MSGPENLKGIDYQIAFSLYEMLKTLKENRDEINSFQFESLNENEEDFNTIFNNGDIFCYQIKKKSEGYQWIPSELKEILTNFENKKSGNCKITKFLFITNAPGNKDVVDFKFFIDNGGVLSTETIDKFKPNSLSYERFFCLLDSVKIETRSFTPSDDNRPAEYVKVAIQNLLLNNPYVIRDKFDIVYSKAWKLIFDYSKKAQTITVHEILKKFHEFNIQIVNQPWLKLPELINFTGRNKQIETIQENLKTYPFQIIYGISGIGKTKLSTYIAQTLILKSKNVFWISIDELLSSKDFLTILNNFLSSSNLNDCAIKINNSEQFELINNIKNIICDNELYFFIDNYNKASDNFKTFLNNIFESILSENCNSHILITSISTPTFYSKFHIQINKIAELNISGLDREDAIELLKKYDCSSSEKLISSFEKHIGIHPLAIILYSQLNNVQHYKLNNAEIEKLSIDSARDYIIKNSINCLPQDEQEALLRLSIIDYSFSDKFIARYINSSLNVKQILDNLRRKSLLSTDGTNFSVHDSISSTARSILSEKQVQILHKELANSIKDSFNKNTTDDELYLWGHHKEKSNHFEANESILLELINCTNDQLAALYEIARYGYPSDYETINLSHSRTITTELIEKKLISHRQAKVKKSLKFELKSFTQLDSIFLWYLCESREISGSRGYVKTFKPNFAFEIQEIICHWEHCIEHFPLPSLIEEQIDDYIKLKKQLYETGIFDGDSNVVTNYIIEILSAPTITEEVISKIKREVQAERCPIFGHCCPGGRTQAEICRSLRNETEQDYEPEEDDSE